jgi:hypothetical protein
VNTVAAGTGGKVTYLPLIAAFVSLTTSHFFCSTLTSHRFSFLVLSLPTLFFFCCHLSSSHTPLLFSPASSLFVRPISPCARTSPIATHNITYPNIKLSTATLSLHVGQSIVCFLFIKIGTHCSWLEFKLNKWSQSASLLSLLGRPKTFVHADRYPFLCISIVS